VVSSYFFGGDAPNNGDLIIGLAARHRLAAMYAGRSFVPGGGLMSYDTDFVNIFGRAASMSIAFSGARSRAIFGCKLRPSSI
jgi:hypothetical protein